MELYCASRRWTTEARKQNWGDGEVARGAGRLKVNTKVVETKFRTGPRCKMNGLPQFTCIYFTRTLIDKQTT